MIKKSGVEIFLGTKTITTLLLWVIGILFVWKLSAILILLLAAAMMAAALNPAVLWLHKKLPLSLAAALTVIGLLVPIIYILVSVVPNFVHQLPVILNTIANTLNSYNILPPQLRHLDFSQYFQNNTAYLWQSTTAVTNFFFFLITFIFSVFYLLVDNKTIHTFLSSLVPPRKRVSTEKMLSELARVSGQYIRGDLFISLICASVIFIGLLLLHVPYALPLAVFAGIFDLLPMIGGVLGATPAIVLGFTVSPLIGLLVIVLFIAYQETENNILAPNIYNKILNLLPFLSFIAVIIGSVLFGVAGAFLALPIAAGIPTIIKYFKEQETNGTANKVLLKK
jgi:predicted PurR-regulated permease PerM